MQCNATSCHYCYRAVIILLRHMQQAPRSGNENNNCKCSAASTTTRHNRRHRAHPAERRSQARLKKHVAILPHLPLLLQTHALSSFPPYLEVPISFGILPICLKHWLLFPSEAQSSRYLLRPASASAIFLARPTPTVLHFGRGSVLGGPESSLLSRFL